MKILELVLHVALSSLFLTAVELFENQCPFCKKCWHFNTWVFVFAFFFRISGEVKLCIM